MSNKTFLFFKFSSILLIAASCETLFATETIARSSIKSEINIPAALLGCLGAILTFTGLFFTAYARQKQNIGNLRSQWIDNLRQEISEFYAQVLALSLFWNAEPLIMKNGKLSDQDLKKFRNENKESYAIIYRSYASIVQRLKYHRGILKRFSGRETRRRELESKMRNILEKFLSNSESCGFGAHDEDLLQVVKISQEIISRERLYVEYWIPVEQAATFILILGCGSAAIYYLVSNTTFIS